jgi:hypothetical protein
LRSARVNAYAGTARQATQIAANAGQFIVGIAVRSIAGNAVAIMNPRIPNTNPKRPPKAIESAASAGWTGSSGTWCTPDEFARARRLSVAVR